MQASSCAHWRCAWVLDVGMSLARHTLTALWQDDMSLPHIFSQWNITKWQWQATWFSIWCEIIDGTGHHISHISAWLGIVVYLLMTYGTAFLVTNCTQFAKNHTDEGVCSLCLWLVLDIHSETVCTCGTCDLFIYTQFFMHRNFCIVVSSVSIIGHIWLSVVIEMESLLSDPVGCDS
jgi:hypothetical protein